MKKMNFLIWVGVCLIFGGTVHQVNAMNMLVSDDDEATAACYRDARLRAMVSTIGNSMANHTKHLQDLALDCFRERHHLRRSDYFNQLIVLLEEKLADEHNEDKKAQVAAKWLAFFNAERQRTQTDWVDDTIHSERLVAYDLLAELLREKIKEGEDNPLQEVLNGLIRFINAENLIRAEIICEERLASYKLLAELLEEKIAAEKCDEVKARLQTKLDRLSRFADEENQRRPQ